MLAGTRGGDRRHHAPVNRPATAYPMTVTMRRAMMLFACEVISMMMTQGEMVWVAPAIIPAAHTTAYSPGSDGLDSTSPTTSPNSRPNDPLTASSGRKMPQGMGSVMDSTHVTNFTTKYTARQANLLAPTTSNAAANLDSPGGGFAPSNTAFTPSRSEMRVYAVDQDSTPMMNPTTPA